MPSLKATRSRKANKKLDELKLGEANASQLKTDHESSGKRPSKSYSRTTGERIAKFKTLTVSEKELIDKITLLRREPFAEVLAMFLDNQPSPDSVQDAADKSPDRYAQSVAVFARLSGYSDKLEVEGNVLHHIKSLSDATLRARLIELGVKVERLDKV